MEFCISADDLRNALKEIKVAEKNGFKHCLSVFKFSSAGTMIYENRAVYSDLLERAHPSDGKLNWGRYQGVTKRHKFKNGKLVKIKVKQ